MFFVYLTNAFTSATRKQAFVSYWLLLFRRNFEKARRCFSVFQFEVVCLLVGCSSRPSMAILALSGWLIGSNIKDFSFKIKKNNAAYGHVKLCPILPTEGAFLGVSTSKPAEASQVTKGASLSSPIPSYSSPAGDEVIWVRPDWNDNPLLLLLHPTPPRHCGSAGPGPPHPFSTHGSTVAAAAVAMAVPQQLSSGQTLLRSVSTSIPELRTENTKAHSHKVSGPVIPFFFLFFSCIRGWW